MLAYVIVSRSTEITCPAEKRGFNRHAITDCQLAPLISFSLDNDARELMTEYDGWFGAGMLPVIDGQITPAYPSPLDLDQGPAGLTPWRVNSLDTYVLLAVIN